MIEKSPIQRKTLSTVKYLRDLGLLTKEHDLLVALLTELTDEWGRATNSTQRSLLSKEIRACIEALPKPEAAPTDETAEFFASLKDSE